MSEDRFEAHPHSDAAAPGANGLRVIRFNATQRGQVRVEASEQRSWQSAMPALKKLVYLVDVVLPGMRRTLRQRRRDLILDLGLSASVQEIRDHNNRMDEQVRSSAGPTGVSSGEFALADISATPG